MASGLEKYATLIFLIADRDQVVHIRVVPAGTAAVIELWRGDAWEELDLTDRSAPLHMPLMRHFALMLLGEMPGQGATLTGTFALERDGKPDIRVLGALAHDFEVSAYFELVDAATYETGRAPQPPRNPACA